MYAQNILHVYSFFLSIERAYILFLFLRKRITNITQMQQVLCPSGATRTCLRWGRCKHAKFFRSTTKYISKKYYKKFKK